MEDPPPPPNPDQDWGFFNDGLKKTQGKRSAATDRENAKAMKLESVASLMVLAARAVPFEGMIPESVTEELERKHPLWAGRGRLDTLPPELQERIVEAAFERNRPPPIVPEAGGLAYWNQTHYSTTPRYIASRDEYEHETTGDSGTRHTTGGDRGVILTYFIPSVVRRSWGYFQ